MKKNEKKQEVFILQVHGRLLETCYIMISVARAHINSPYVRKQLIGLDIFMTPRYTLLLYNYCHVQIMSIERIVDAS